MSEYFAGVTFPEQAVTPSDDGVFRRAVLPDGILTGCGLGYSGSTLNMGAGYLLLCGRVVRHTAIQYWPVSDATSGYARLILTADLSRPSTKDSFDQVVDSIEYATSANGFAPLVQSDINGSGTKYQIEVCVVSLGTGGITGIVRQIARIDSYNMYAPAGYGLGPQARRSVASLSELDSLVDTGWYNLDDPSGSVVLFGMSVNHTVVSVEAYDAASGLQTIRVPGSLASIWRTRSDGSWDSWCVDNPPMELSVEYRTSETWSGQPVFSKRIAYTADSFTAELVKLPHEVNGLDICISAAAVWKRTDIADDGWRTIPSSDPSSGSNDGHIEFVNAESVAFRLGSSLRSKVAKSTEPVYVILKYTKL